MLGGNTKHLTRIRNYLICWYKLQLSGWLIGRTNKGRIVSKRKRCYQTITWIAFSSQKLHL